MYRIRVTVVGKQWGSHGWDDPMQKLFVIEKSVFGFLWLPVHHTCSEFSARKELDKLRAKQVKSKSSVEFKDYILEEK